MSKTAYRVEICNVGGDHAEAIDVEFDTSLTTYRNLLDLFWDTHDPTLYKKRQYMSAIFYHNEAQKRTAYLSKIEREEMLGTIVETQILPFEKFYNAENYHQKYVMRTYHRSLYKSLDLSDEELLTSTVAARLNGYVGGYGTVEAFNQEYLGFGLTVENIEYVRKMFWP